MYKSRCCTRVAKETRMNQTQCLGAVAIDLDGVKYRKYYEKNKKRLQSNTEGPATIYHGGSISLIEHISIIYHFLLYTFKFLLAANYVYLFIFSESQIV